MSQGLRRARGECTFHSLACPTLIDAQDLSFSVSHRKKYRLPHPTIHRSPDRVTASTGLGSLVNGAAKTTIALLRNASLSFQVSGVYTDSDSTPGPSAGDSVSYSLLVKNTGTATIWGAVVSAELGDRITCVPALESLQLAPGDISRCSSSYEVSLSTSRSSDQNVCHASKKRQRV